MGKVISVGFGLLIVIIGILMFPNMTASIEDADSTEFEETFVNVTTEAGQTTATCDLTEPLYNGDIKQVLGIKSDNSNDYPSAYSYDKNEDSLTIKSLASGYSRNLTISYLTVSGGFLGLSKFFSISPLLIFITLIGILGLAVWAGFFRGRG